MEDGKVAALAYVRVDQADLLLAALIATLAPAHAREVQKLWTKLHEAHAARATQDPVVLEGLRNAREALQAKIAEATRARSLLEE